MNDEQKEQLAILEAAVDDAWDQLDDSGCDLVNSNPTTLACVAALCRYVEPLLNERNTVNLPEDIHWDDDTRSSAGGALMNAIACRSTQSLQGSALMTGEIVEFPGREPPAEGYSEQH